MQCFVCKHRGPAEPKDFDDIDLVSKEPFKMASDQLLTTEQCGCDLPRVFTTHRIYVCPKCGHMFAKEKL